MARYRVAGAWVTAVSQLIVLTIVTSVSPAWAQQAASSAEPGASSATPPASSATPDADSPRPVTPETAGSTVSAEAPDIVVLNDGSFTRGTIAELVAGDHVLIVSAAGDTRRFPMTQVRYAGPAASMPPRATTPQASAAEEAKDMVTVHFKASGAPASLHVWTYTKLDGSLPAAPFAEREAVCTAPCKVKLPVGRYGFSLSGVRGHVERIPGQFTLKGDATMTGTYLDRRGPRIAGWLLLGISAAAASTALVLGSETVQLAGGVGGAVGVIIGLVLGLSPDSASVSGGPAPALQYSR